MNKKRKQIVLGETAEERKGRQVAGAAGVPDDDIIDDRMFDSDGRVWVVHPDHRRNGMLIWPVNAEEYIRDRGYRYMTQQYWIDRIDAIGQVVTKANAQAEHFEREWYLRRDRIEELEAVVRKCFATASLPGNYRDACYCVRQFCQDAKIEIATNSGEAKL